MAPLVVPLLQDPEPETRRRALWLLEEMRAIEHIGDIVLLLQDSDRRVRRKALHALVELKAREQSCCLLPFLEGTDEGMRKAAAAAIGKLGSKQHASALLPLLEEADPTVRSTGITALGKLLARQFAAIIVPFLEDDDVRVRRCAAKVLGRLHARQYADRLLPLLDQKDSNDPNRLLPRFALEALASMGAIEHAEHVVRLLGHRDPRVRAEAASALSRMWAVEHAAAMLPLVSDGYKGTRAAAGNSLAKLAPERFRSELAALLRDEERLVRWCTLRGLAWHGKPQYLPLITPLMKDEDGLVRSETVGALARMGLRENLQRLGCMLDDKSASVKGDVLVTLGEMGSRLLSVPELEELAETLRQWESDSNWFVRTAASVALLRLGYKTFEAQKSLLRELMEEGGDFHCPHGQAIADALNYLYEREAYGKLTSGVELKGPIESREELEALLERFNLSLEEACFPLGGRLPAGIELTPMRALAWMIDDDLDWSIDYAEVVPVLKGSAVHIMEVEAALEYWRKRLEKNAGRSPGVSGESQRKPTSPPVRGASSGG